MAEHVLLVEQPGDWKDHFPAMPVVAAKDYLAGAEYGANASLRVINLCRSYRYLSLGYYCSLLAEARRHRVIPTGRTIQDLSRRAIYSLDTADLDHLVHRALGRRRGGIETTAFEMVLFFGQGAPKELSEVAQQLFLTFPVPILKVEFKLQGAWRISSVRALSHDGLSPDQEAQFFEALDNFLSRRWRKPRAKSPYKYDLAILYNPGEQMPPSDRKALANFIRVGKTRGVDVELIDRKDYGRLAEYDALFIRETTRIGHYTYQFAKKADSEGMVVIDDPDSILKCTNKVYLAELLRANRVPIPRTMVLRRENLLDVESVIPYPVVLKIPEGSFSRGVFKAEDRAQMQAIAKSILKDSDLLLAQEFLYTQFDWRVGILRRQPLFVCKYYMSKQHWQIVRYDTKGGPKEGGYETVDAVAAPPAVIKTALRAANLIGDGLYGVDLKETPKGVVVIEVNDNPNIDANVEDAVLKDDLYRTVIDDFVDRLDRKRKC